MEIRYVSAFSSQKLINTIHKNTGTNPGFAIQKFSRLIVSGLITNGTKVHALSSPPLGKWKSRKIFINLKSEIENDIHFKYVPFINVKIIKHICIFIYSFFSTIFWGIRYKRDKVVICDVLSISICLGTLLGSKLVGIKSIGIVTDIYELMVGVTSNWLSRMACFINNKYVSSFDKYILLTEEMNEVVNAKHKPYIVMEAICDSHISEELTNVYTKTKPRVVLYAGGLYERYGLKMLVDAFIKSNVDAQLVLYGSGSYVDELRVICQTHPNIEYRGVVSNNEVVVAQRYASLLVNPRFSTEEFTKYSFPSKNIEYMSSGTPLLTTKLPGMPQDYYPFVFLFEDETIDGYVDAIIRALSYTDDYLNQFGAMAQKFVFETKNNAIQTKRIIDLINGA